MIIKIILTFGLLNLSLLGFAQIKNYQTLKTAKYAGNYSFGGNLEEGPGGWVTIFPETDNTILFYLDICVGATSYNLGQLYDRLKIENGIGLYSKKFDDKRGCKWKMEIKNKILTIDTIDGCFECGFGHGVVVDHIYKQLDDSIHEYFIDGHNHKIFFSKTSPENYSKYWQ